MARAERLLIWGAGGHGKVLADVARACGHEVVGYADGGAGLLGKVVEPGGASVIVAEQELVRLLASGAPLPHDATALALAVGDNHARARHLALAARHALPALVHPGAEVSPSAALGAATVVFPRAVINASTRIGAACIINTGAIVEHDCTVGNAVHVSPGAVLLGGVQVGAESWIGARAVVRTGLRIGSDCMVGMGAVVIREVPDHVTVVGNPARPLGAGVGR